MQWLFAIYAFAIGAIAGSFLNVVIHRYPREESIVFPASHCPRCKARIAPYDNVPILSYLVLLGRCRNCKKPISLRYLLVELANALFYLALYLHAGVTVAAVLLAAAVSMTILLIYIDAEIHILPDVIDLPGVAIGLGLGAIGAGSSLPALMVCQSLTDALLGALFGAGIILAIIGVYWLVRRVEGMGQGDVKMMAMIGAVLGWEGAAMVLFLASVTGAMIGIPAALRSPHGMKLALPFGLFLGFSFLAVLFFGPTLSTWYLLLLSR